MNFLCSVSIAALLGTLTVPVKGNPAASLPSATPQPANGDAIGWDIKGLHINDLFQWLARMGGKQYFSNEEIGDIVVTGQIIKGDPIEKMKEIAIMYNLVIYQKGQTVYALTQDQVSGLPATQAQYVLEYLRPVRARLEELLRPMLTPDRGSVQFEEKTGTIVLIDNEQRIQQAMEFLRKIDRPKRQVVVRCRIFRVNNTLTKSQGVDWSPTLGASTGLTLTAQATNVYSYLLGASGASSIIVGGTNAGTVKTLTGGAGAPFVLNQPTVNVVVKALQDRNLVEQISEPCLATEDNEMATVGIVDRIPIITTEQNGSSGTLETTTKVRYQIDEHDAPKDREIGVKLRVTPTILPDGTIRMVLYPSVAAITGYVAGQNVGGITNEYPTVNEASLESIARIPSGYSLVIGGFYQVQKTNDDNKVPVLGDIPGIKLLFTNKSHQTTKTNLVFILTPETYEPTDIVGATNASERMSDMLQDASAASLTTPEQKWEREYIARMRNVGLPKGVSELK